MKITSIPQLVRHGGRWLEILAVLSRFGLADWLSRINVEFAKDQLKDRDGLALARHSTEKRIRLALGELGPIFIKFGQLLSTRPDLIGPVLADELAQLQLEAPADSFATVRDTVESQLGQPLEELFMEFSEEPLASASIGQVHVARLNSGERVVVKVQHHAIERYVARDMDVLGGLATLAERFEELAVYHPREIVAEVGRSLRRELDFGREERNLQQFAALYNDGARVRIPRPFSELSTSKVLTMEYIEGAKVCDLSKSPERFDPELIATRGAELYLDMIFENGFFHADPHPGNIVLLPGNVLGLVDFGMVGRLDERLRESIEEMLMAIVNRDNLMLTAIIRRVGKLPPNFDESMLNIDLAEFISMHGNKSIVDFNLGAALNDMTGIIRQHQISLPAQAAMLIKTLITLEGTAKLLSPRFSLLELIVPYHRKLLLRRMSPSRQVRKMRRLAVEMEHLVEQMPQRMMDILEQIREGKFDVHLDHRGLGPSVNRLVLGLLCSALFLGSSQMLSSQVSPLLFAGRPFWGMENVSLLGLTGCTVSILIGLRLLRAIVKSGHLDRKDY
ncbi:MAG: AarF/ABC1/UbiB kinase family protein [Planctomycetales bacterium]|nr:AarF/ABC1/UbiB kinase family protein [Planctomycetales bacterium]